MDKRVQELMTEMAEDDLGLQPRKEEQAFTDTERMLIAISMAAQAAMVQLILERAIPPHENLHFMTHLQDFAARLYDGEDVAFKGQPQTFRVDSRQGEVFLEVTKAAIKTGKIPHEAEIADKVVIKGDDDVKPTLH